MRKSARVERLADAGDAAVHHVAWRHQIRAGARLDDSGLPQQVHGRIIVHVAARDHAAMAVIGVLAQADVPDDDQIGDRALYRANRLLHDPLIVVRLRASRVLRRRNPEQDHAAQSERRGALGIFHQLIHGELRHAWQGGDGAAHSFAVHDELRPHQLRRNDMRLGH